MLFEALRNGEVVDRWEVYSVGGGALWDELGTFKEEDVYPDTKMTDILDWCKAEGRSFVEYVELHEGPEIFDYLEEVWKVMVTSIHNGLENEGVLPGNLRLARKACSYHVRAQQSAGTLTPHGNGICCRFGGCRRECGRR